MVCLPFVASRRTLPPAASLLAFALLLSATPAVAQDADPDPPRLHNSLITIDLRPTAVMQGQDLRATVKVAPKSGNRLLSVMIDAPTFYASTERELEGATTPRTHTFRWDKLPAGIYLIEAKVTDASGHLTRVSRQFIVYGSSPADEYQPTTPTPGRRGRRGTQ